MKYTDQEVAQAFRLSYLDEHGTLIGWTDAYEWWLHPEYKCAMQTSPTKKTVMCNKICPSCLIYSKQ